MSAVKPHHDKAGLGFYEHPMGDERAYVKALAVRFPGTIEFETGCGHIEHDLMARLPSVPQMEQSKTAFCHVVAGLVSPLAACLFAKSICLRMHASSNPTPAPEVMAGIGTYSVFDVQAGDIRHCMLPPPDRVAYESAFLIASGLTVLCEPLDLAGNEFRDSTRDQVHNVTTDAVWNWTERMLRAMHEQSDKPFVVERLRIRTTGLAGQILGVVENAAVQAVASGMGIAGTLIQGNRPEAPRHITPAFVHEAGFAETASHPKTKEPAPSDAHEHQQSHVTAPPKPDVS